MHHRFTFLDKSFRSGQPGLLSLREYFHLPELSSTHGGGRSCAVFGRVPQQVDHGALTGAPWVSLSLRAREIRLGRRGSCLHVSRFPTSTRYRPGIPVSGPQTGTHHGLLGTRVHSRVKPAEGKTILSSIRGKTVLHDTGPWCPLETADIDALTYVGPGPWCPKCWRPPIRMPSPM